MLTDSQKASIGMYIIPTKLILFVYFLALLSSFILYHSSDAVTIYNFFKQFIKARPNTEKEKQTYFILRFLYL